MGEIIPWAPAYPYIPSNPRKQLFINYRIAGHTEREAMLLVGVKERALYKWKQLDKDFAYWNSDGIEQLRKESREKLVGDLFAINAHMVEQIDQVFLRRISAKINKGVVLTQEEQKQLDKLRNLYAMPTQQQAAKNYVKEGKKEGTSIVQFFLDMDKRKGETVDGVFREVNDEVPHLSTPLGQT